MSLWEAEEASLWLAAHVITTAPQRHTTMMMSLLLLPRRRTVELFWIEWWLKRNRWISVVNEVLFEIQLLFHAAVVVDQMWFVNSVCGCLRAGPPTTNDSEDAAKYWIVSLSEVLKTNFRWDDLVSVPGKLNWVGIVHLFSKSFFRLRSSKEGSYLAQFDENVTCWPDRKTVSWWSRQIPIPSNRNRGDAYGDDYVDEAGRYMLSQTNGSEKKSGPVFH